MGQTMVGNENRGIYYLLVLDSRMPEGQYMWSTGIDRSSAHSSLPQEGNVARVHSCLAALTITSRKNAEFEIEKRGFSK